MLVQGHYKTVCEHFMASRATQIPTSTLEEHNEGGSENLFWYTKNLPVSLQKVKRWNAPVRFCLSNPTVFRWSKQYFEYFWQAPAMFRLAKNTQNIVPTTGTPWGLRNKMSVCVSLFEAISPNLPYTGIYGSLNTLPNPPARCRE